jgi:hypothetical protein
MTLFLGVQILLPYPWKKLPRLFPWWPHKFWGEWDNIVVCLWSSIMLKVILQKKKKKKKKIKKKKNGLKKYN